MDWYEETFRATVVCLTASLALLVPGTAGISGSPALVVALLAAAGLLFIGREQFDSGRRLAGHDVRYVGRVLWAGPAVAALVVVLSLDATGAELQALGGLVGLVGMANYFLRPVYHALYTAVATVTGTRN